jgi:hypothetical protein
LNFLRRHPLAAALALLVLVGAVFPLPALVDAVTGSVPGGADLVRPFWYVAAAPVSNVLDTLTFFSLGRAWWGLGLWIALLGALGARRPGPLLSRTWRAARGPLGVLGLVAAAVLLPRPVPRIAVADATLTVLDYHAHTQASHDGRSRWTANRVLRWHARQGFEATYITDHNQVYVGASRGPIALLPGVEWSVHRQHVLALGPAREIIREDFSRTTERMLGVFSEIDRQGAIAIAALPEYWRNYWDGLEAIVEAGVHGFEIMDCSPKSLAFPRNARRRVVRLAMANGLLVVGGSDNHGWGAVTCVWNLASPGASGIAANRVIARTIALRQSEGPAWAAAVTQPALMFRTLSWSERISWLTWIAVILIYRGIPRREGDPAGLGILARSLKLRAMFRNPATRGTDGTSRTRGTTP